ncbi:MAG: 6-carboxytetrahydropterin synthase [Planctomycetes bacterium]|nr:6-carboxytetrahydropterin synthase [Planctomycetota bacterium]
MRVTKEFTFEAAHGLASYRGKPEPLHGHTWRLAVTLEGPLDEEGMVYDFLELDRIVRERVLSHLDHSNLNDLLPQSSAERLAIWIWERLADLPLAEIKVWETASGYVTYTGPFLSA